MKLIAITGSIGCGKTTIAKIIRKQGFVVFDVDAWVRRLYFNKDFICSLKNVYPMVVDDFKVDKKKLRNIVFNDYKQLKQLESMIHPFLRRYLKSVISKNSRYKGCFFIDVALLFEMGWDKYCNKIIVADVNYEVQKNRVMKRDNIKADDFDKINNVQINNELKKKKADIVINTDKPFHILKLDIIKMLKNLE